MHDLDLDTLDTDELRALQQQRYVAHTAQIQQLASIARVLGRDPAPPGYSSTYGPKYRYEQSDIVLYLDDYGHYLTVHVAGKAVCSTHPTNRFIIPGPWLATLLAHHEQVQAILRARQQAQETAERAALLERLR